MSLSGNQIKAARALAGMDQKALADAAGVGINTIRNFEGAGQAIVRGRIDTLEAIRSALFTAGVELLDDGQTSASGPGVRLRRE
eukprot:gene7100-8755_t